MPGSVVRSPGWAVSILLEVYLTDVTWKIPLGSGATVTPVMSSYKPIASRPIRQQSNPPMVNIYGSVI